jgi:hypothetical protein
MHVSTLVDHASGVFTGVPIVIAEASCTIITLPGQRHVARRILLYEMLEAGISYTTLLQVIVTPPTRMT